MPRVTQHTASNRGRTYRCTGCGEEITEGQRYYMWVRRIGPKSGYRRHVECGYPRPSELSGAKTAVIDDEVQSYTTPELEPLNYLEAGTHPEYLELDVGAFEDAVSAIADTADGVADEYESGADNMPDSLQDSPTAEAMRDVAERLRTYVEELRDKAGESLTVDLPEWEDGADQDEWAQQAQEAIEEAWGERDSEVTDLMGDVPMYEG